MSLPCCFSRHSDTATLNIGYYALIGGIVGDEFVDFGDSADSGGGDPANLRAVGDDDHPFGTRHHRGSADRFIPMTYGQAGLDGYSIDADDGDGQTDPVEEPDQVRTE
nr:hypothetical protein [Phytoactinopolyspora mesophila]